MRIALYFSGKNHAGNSEFADFLEQVAHAAMWEILRTGLSTEIEQFAPDLVIALDPFAPKLTSHLWIGWFAADPAAFRNDRDRLQTLLSHDAWITAGWSQQQFLDDLLVPTGKHPAILAMQDDSNRAEQLVHGLGDLVSRARIAAGVDPDPELSQLTVDYIVRVGGRDRRYVARCLASLAGQTAGRIGVILVRYGEVSGLDEEIATLSDRLRRVLIIDVPPDSCRSTSLWAGIQAVDASCFGMLDDDDALHPNHVATLLSLFRTQDAGVAYSGSIRVWENPDHPGLPTDLSAENRGLLMMDPPRVSDLFAWQASIHSSAFLATSALRNRLGPDPHLDMFEDAYLIRRLVRQAGLAASWRPTTDVYWRDSRNDNTAFDQNHRKEAQLRIADRERFDPVINSWLHHGGSALRPEPASMRFWGEPGTTDRLTLPLIATPADVQALPGDRPLYICGTGQGGRIVRAEIEKFDHLDIVGFVDSFRDGNFDHHPVLRPENISQADRENGVFVIASQHVQEIAGRLLPMGFRDLRDASPYILVYVNLRRLGG